jgi:ferredoxin
MPARKGYSLGGPALAADRRGRKTAALAQRKECAIWHRQVDAVSSPGTTMTTRSASHVPRLVVLIGLTDIAAGEIHLLGPCADVVIGRSRACDISTQRFHRYLGMSAEQRLQRRNQDHAISRRHLRITSDGSWIRLENLSLQGTYCAGQRFDRVLEIDLALASVELRLGGPDGPSFRLTVLDAAEVAGQPLAPSGAPAADDAADPEDERAVTIRHARRAEPDSAPPPAQAPPRPPALTFPGPDGPTTRPFPPGGELLAFLEEQGAACAARGCGMGICHTCRLRVLAGREHVAVLHPHARHGLHEDDILACCATITGPVAITEVGPDPRTAHDP